MDAIKAQQACFDNWHRKMANMRTSAKIFFGFMVFWITLGLIQPTEPDPRPTWMAMLNMATSLSFIFMLGSYGISIAQYLKEKMDTASFRGTISPATKSKRIAVDGSNVMFWGEGDPSISRVANVLGHLVQHGYAPHVFFDATVGYKLFNRHVGSDEIAKYLPVTKDAITICPGGSPADDFVLQFATDLDLRVVTNDRYRDWTEKHKTATNEERLVKGELVGTHVLMPNL
jgi:hypothetical protein